MIVKHFHKPGELMRTLVIDDYLGEVIFRLSRLLGYSRPLLSTHNHVYWDLLCAMDAKGIGPDRIAFVLGDVVQRKDFWM